MDTNMQNTHHDSDKSLIDIRRLIQCVLNKAWQIGLVTFLCGVIAFAGSVLLITPEYQASALFYVNNSSVSIGDAALSISSGDITTSKNLVNSYSVILKSRATLLDVIDYADSNRTYMQLKGMISASSVDNTEVFQVTVTSTDPREAEILANAIAHVMPDRIASIIEGSSAKIVDLAVLPSSPSYPNNMRNMFLGLLVGFSLSAGFVILIEFIDVTIKDEDDIGRCCDYPILATVPYLLKSKYGYRYNSSYYKYRYHTKKAKKKVKSVAGKTEGKLNFELDFPTTEAYKLLRTKLQYSFADEQCCRVFAISSAMAGEGKSISAARIANSLAQLDKRVLVIDCDLRRPTLAEKLGMRKFPGLSENLTGFAKLDDVIQQCNIAETNTNFDVITAGNRPPNPVELINSSKMSVSIQNLRTRYDYIILDMPPIGEVSDALAASKLADGVLFVIRQNYGNRLAVEESINQFEFVGAKILGVLFNCVTDYATRKKYSYKYYEQYNLDKLNEEQKASNSK